MTIHIELTGEQLKLLRDLVSDAIEDAEIDVQLFGQAVDSKLIEDFSNFHLDELINIRNRLSALSRALSLVE